MIRFIDLRGQIYEVEDTPVHFAFFETVTETFLRIDNNEEWTTRADFERDHRAEYGERVAARTLLRFTKLMPEWVK
jgi:hypothetical protein